MSASERDRLLQDSRAAPGEKTGLNANKRGGPRLNPAPAPLLNNNTAVNANKRGGTRNQ
jgi:hypothetical protein